MYIAINLYYFTMSHLRNKKDIYYISLNIFDNAGSNSNAFIIQSNSTWINRLRDRIAAKI